MGCMPSHAVPEEEMMTYRHITRGHFNDRILLKMHEAFYHAAPDGEMQVGQFLVYLEKLASMGVCSFKETHKGLIDHDTQAKKLFRGYSHKGGDTISFSDYLESQDAIIHRSGVLPKFVFAVIDMNRDGLIWSSDLVCMVQGTEVVVEDEYLELMTEQVAGLWLHLCGTSDVTAVDLERFEKVLNNNPGMLDKMLAIL